ncbi:MAG: MFS transporter [Acidobacteria bacterium]|nr:MFS transporter [Acidobacteriota bacterium]MCB9398826.1 MFS transporter [Acidobacteriota bacterium]
MRRLFRHYQSAFRGLPPAIWLLSCVMFINRSGSLVLVFLSLYTTQKLGFTPIQAGSLLTLYGCGAILGTLFGGWLCDRVSALRVQMISLILSASLLLFLEFIHSYHNLALFIGLLGIVTELFRPANVAALSSFCPVDLYPRAFGLNRLAINFGTSIGPAIGGYMVQFGYAWAFRMDALTCLLAALAIPIFFRNLQTPSHSDNNPSETVIKRVPWRDKPYLFFLACYFALGLVIFQFFAAYPIYLKEQVQLSARTFGNFMALNGLLIVAFEMALIKKWEHLSSLKMMAFGLALVALGFGLLPLNRSFGWALSLVFIWTLGEIFAAPAAASFAASHAPKKGRGLYMGWFTSTFSISLLAGPALGSYLYQRFSPDSVWYVLGPFGLLCSAGIFWMDRKNTRKKAAAAQNDKMVI